MSDSSNNRPPVDPYSDAAEQQRLRVEAPSPASFRTKRDLVSDRVHGVARERHRAELEVEAKARPWKRHKTLIFVVVGVCVAFALHVFGLLLALDDPEIKVQPGVRAIVASIPPSNPGNVAPDEGASGETLGSEDASNAPAPESVSVTPESRVLTKLEREIEEGGIKIITASGEEITIPVGPIGASTESSSLTNEPSDNAVTSTAHAVPELQPAVVVSSTSTGGETASTSADLVEVVTRASIEDSSSLIETAVVSTTQPEPVVVLEESAAVELSTPVVISEPATDPVQDEIDSLLATATQYLQRKRLTTPSGANAYELYRRVLEIDAANEDAALGIESIYGQYLTWAMNAEKSGNASKALANYEKALRVNPGADAITERVAQIQRDAEAEKVASVAPAPSVEAPAVAEVEAKAAPAPEAAASTETPEMLAAREQLESLGLDMNARAMVVSVDQGDYKAVQLLMNAGLSPDVRHGKYGFSPLILTAIRGDGGLMDLLLDNQADVDLRSDDGRTALMAAAWNGHGDIVSQLVAKGANVTLSNTDGWTAMHYAAWKGYSGIVSLLLRNGADPGHRNSDGWTVRETAERQGFIEVMEAIDARASG